MWIVATDGTATNGRLGIIDIDGKSFLVGHDHLINEETEINLERQADSEDTLVLQGKVINGLESVPDLQRTGLLIVRSVMHRTCSLSANHQ